MGLAHVRAPDFVVATSPEEAERKLKRRHKGRETVTGVEEVKVRGHKMTLEKIVKASQDKAK